MWNRWTSSTGSDRRQSEPTENVTPADETGASEETPMSAERKKFEFAADIQTLLDFIARSLYPNKEIFIKELISNACDALEKARLRKERAGMTLTESYSDLKINVYTYKKTPTIVIEDNGIGMTKDELVTNLGTIARSGSKEFIKQLKDEGQEIDQSSAIIGQFGVGFYSVFMVAKEVTVLSKKNDKEAHRWICDGSSMYSIQKANKKNPGTRITVHLKKDSAQFVDSEVLKELIRKHNGLVRYPIFIDGESMQVVKPLWNINPRNVHHQDYKDLYQWAFGSDDKFSFVLHFIVDVPVKLKALIYFPKTKPKSYRRPYTTDETEIQLYVHQVLITEVREEFVPDWLRFVKGMIETEDLPLELNRISSRIAELHCFSQIQETIVSRILRFLWYKTLGAKKEFLVFYKLYGFFLQLGIIRERDQTRKEEIAKLLFFESTALPAGELTSFDEYCSRMKPGQRDIFYFLTSKRISYEKSPFFVMLKESKIEVLLCYETYDERVFSQLLTYSSYNIAPIEQEFRKAAKLPTGPLAPGSLSESAIEYFRFWIEKIPLRYKVRKVVVNQKLDSHPCTVSVENIMAARSFVRKNPRDFFDDDKFIVFNPYFEINPRHPLIKRLEQTYLIRENLAILAVEQMYRCALVYTGLLTDPQIATKKIDEILELSFQSVG